MLIIVRYSIIDFVADKRRQTGRGTVQELDMAGYRAGVTYIKYAIYIATIYCLIFMIRLLITLSPTTFDFFYLFAISVNSHDMCILPTSSFIFFFVVFALCLGVHCFLSFPSFSVLVV